MRGSIALALALVAAPCAAQFSVPGLPGTLGRPGFTLPLSGIAPFGLTALRVSSAQWSSTTDITPVTQFTDGWTADATFASIAPAGTFAAYNVTPYASTSLKLLTIPVTSPGYDASGNSTTISRSVYATQALRQPGSTTAPTESGTTNATVSLALSDWIYSGDTLGTATVGAGLYTNGVANSASTVAPTLGTLPAYPRPIGQWVTEPGLRIDPTVGTTVEFFAGHARAQGGQPLAAVKITLTDAGSHPVTKTISAMTPSQRTVSTTCTATNGSAVLTSCTNTAAFLVGSRATVAGIPGQPLLASKTSTSLTFGQTIACTTNTTGQVTFSTAPAAGQAFLDGGFVGQTITNANLSGGVATISTRPTSSNITYVSNKPTSVAVQTSASSSASGAGTCTINHLYQGTTGTVTVYAGVPLWVWSATFSPSDLSTLTTDGVAYWRAIGYPVVGNVTLDTQTGADGTGKDWQGLTFATAGTDISPNLHNLWAYLDRAGTFAPKYAWVSGTAGGSPAVQTTSADPGSSAYYGTPFAAVTALKAAYGGTSAHGGVVCLLAAGSPYAAKGGEFDTLANTANKPPLTFTSATAGNACPSTGAAGSDTTVTWAQDTATAANNLVGRNWHFHNLTLTNSTNNTFKGVDTSLPSAFPTNEIILDGDFVTPGSGAMFYTLGSRRFYNSLINENIEGHALLPYNGLHTNFPAAIGNTVICGNYATAGAGFMSFTVLGNATWNCNMTPSGYEATNANSPQPKSSVVAFNKFMGNTVQQYVGGGISPIFNLLNVNNVCEGLVQANNPCYKISADASITTADNVALFYDLYAGSRFSYYYEEGTGVGTPSATTGGSLAAGTYYVLVTFTAPGSVAGGSTTESAFDAVSTVTGVAGSGAINVTIPPDLTGRKAWVYVDTVNPPAHLGSAAACPSGGDCAALTIGVNGQTLKVLNNATARTAPTGLPGFNVVKSNLMLRYTISAGETIKGDNYSVYRADGGRVGNWAARFHVGHIGNVNYVPGVIGTTTPGPTSGFGDFYQGYTNPGTNGADLSQISFQDDRSMGNGVQGSAVAPGLDLGQGNYCLSSGSAQGLGVVPSGLAAWPIDIQGRVRLNDGTGAAGPYERGCL